jgi:hypothetical protein
LSPTPQDAAAYRERLAAAIVAALAEEPAVRAVGEGGAAARGRADAFSDLDLVIVGALDSAAAIFAKVERAARKFGAISHAWSVEPAPFAGLAQRIYLLEGAPRFFALDCCVFSAEGVTPFLERERHGEMVVWLDREGLLKPRRINRTEGKARRALRLAQLRGGAPVYALLLEKELARGHALEAMGFYQALLRALVEVLGLQHRPDRADFGWRYVERELPADAQTTLARFAFVPDAAALQRLGRALAAELQTRLAQLS